MVIVKMNSGLSYQMFQFALGKSWALKQNTDVNWISQDLGYTIKALGKEIR
jgi:hypothetical protein